MSDSTPLLEQIEPSQSQKEVTANGLFAAVSMAAAYGLHAEGMSGLTWAYYGTRYGGAPVANGTHACTASDNTYMAVDLSDGSVSFATTTTDWDDALHFGRAYKIVAGASTITAWEDHRFGPAGIFSAAATAGGVPAGGTGVAAFTAYAPVFGGTTSTGALQSGTVGSAGQVLTSNGAGVLPSFEDVPSSAGRHAVPVLAGSMRSSVSGGCAALAAVASGANNPDILTLDFDAGTAEYAQFAIPMPKSWDEGTVTFEAHWSHAATTTNFGVVWSLQAVAVSNADTIAAAYGTAQTSTDTGGTTDSLYISPESSAITVAGTPAAGDMVFFRIARVATDGADTLAVDARLHGITLFINTSALTDA